MIREELRQTLLVALMIGTLSTVRADEWELVHADTFDRKEVGDAWKLESGDWKVDDGDLVCASEGTLFLNQAVPGCHRLEFTVTAKVPGDLTPLLHTDGKGIFSGYFVQYGGYNNTVNKGRRLKEYITFDDQHLVTADTPHHIVAEFDNDTLRLTVDGEPVYSYKETQGALVGEDHAYPGIYIYIGARIHEIKVWTKPFSGNRAVTGAPTRIAANLASRVGIPIVPDGPVGPDGNLMKAGDAEDPTVFPRWGGRVHRTTNDAHSGKASISLPREGSAVLPYLIPIDTSKTYELSGWFKSLTPDTPARLLFDARYVTADFQSIGNTTIRPTSGISSLATEAKAGDTIVNVVKSDWKQDDRYVLIFDAREDLSDLPNFSGISIAGYDDTGEHLRITLEKPLTETYPAGTRVRTHHYLDYPRAVGKLTTKWTRISFRLQPTPPPEMDWRLFYWPGARYLGITMIHQYAGYPEKLPDVMGPPHVLIDDITVKEVK